jgi:hypothetical protein
LIRKESDPSFSLMMDPTISEIFYYLIATQNMCELAECKGRRKNETGGGRIV